MKFFESNRFKFLSSKGRIAAALALIAALFAFGALAIADEQATLAELPEEIKVDPMGGEWKQRVYAKQRMILGDFGSGGYLSMSECGGERNGELYCSPMTIDNTPFDGADVYGYSITEGNILTDITLEEDFYGVKTIENAPRNVAVMSYLVPSDAADATEGEAKIMLRMIGDNGNGINLIAQGEILSMYSHENKRGYVYWKSDTGRDHTPELKANTNHEILGWDVNKDGFTDYIVSYIYGSAEDESSVAYDVIDGKTLYANGTGEGKTIMPLEINSAEGGDEEVYSLYENVTGGLTDVAPPHSYRIAVGDFDGDGQPEIASVFTKIHGTIAGEARKNYLFINKLNHKQEAKTDGNNSRIKDVYSYKRVYTDDNAGKNYMQNDSVGLVAGDIDGDGRDELIQLYAYTHLLYEQSKVFMNIYRFDGKDENGNDKYVKFVSDAEVGKIYAHTGSTESVSALNMSLSDLDGDLTKELVWTVSGEKGDADGSDAKYVPKLHVHKWDVEYGKEKIADTGTQYTYNLYKSENSTASLGWLLSEKSMKFGLCTGRFLEKGHGNTLSIENQIGLSSVCRNKTFEGKYDSNSAYLMWNSKDGLRVIDDEYLLSRSYSYPVGTVATAADLYCESMVLGRPTVINVEGNIELMMLVQAPPKHWDEVSAIGSRLEHYADKTTGLVKMDAFSLFGGSPYSTTVTKNDSVAQGKSVTTVSRGKDGLSISYQQQRRGLKPGGKLWGKDEQMKPDPDPMVDAGVKYSANIVKDHTESNSTKITTELDFAADRDDQLLYNSMNYNVCRYPILFPADKRYQINKDNPEVKLQRYIQFIVPTSSTATFAPAPGRSVDWYDPMHDNYNLFTYPKRLKDIKGYPLGKEAKLPSDPMYEKNGVILATQPELYIGNPDWAKYTLSIVDTEGDKKLDNLEHTVEGHVYGHPSFGSTGKAKLNINADGGYTWGTDVTTTQDTTNMQTITTQWPGLNKYKTVIDNWAPEDMAFDAELSYYTQDDGAICVSYAIPNLMQQLSRSRMWGSGSPYYAHPDPGLILPYRWNNAIPATGVGLVRNPEESGMLYTMRGLTLEPLDANGFSYGAANYKGSAIKLLEHDALYKISARVVNYSFKDTILETEKVGKKNLPVGPVKVKFYIQYFSPIPPDAPRDENGNIIIDNLELDLPATDPATDSRCKLIDSSAEFAEQTVTELHNIEGRTNKENTHNNWETASVVFKVPAVDAVPNQRNLAWIHTVVEFKGNDARRTYELSKDNNHGYALVGFFNSTDFLPDETVSANLRSSEPVAVESMPDLAITKVEAFAIKKDVKGNEVCDKNGAPVYEKVKIDGSSRYKKLKIRATVGFKGGCTASDMKVTKLPAIKTILFTGKGKQPTGILAGKSYPVLREGCVKTFELDYDPVQTNPKNKAVIVASSQFLSPGEQKDPKSQIKVLWDEEPESTNSGCNAGYAGLALLMLIPALFKKKD